MTRVGIIETGSPLDRRPSCADFPKMFRDYFAGQSGMEFSTFSIFRGVALPEPNTCDAWLITGSPAGVYENLSWILSLADFVRQTIGQSVPMLGICFGHQLMAQALGGTVEKSDKGRGIGVHEYELTGAGKKLFSGAHKLNLIAAHQDQVTKPPPGAELLASSDFCEYAGFMYGNAGLSLQGHPEFTADFERELIEDWQETSPAPIAVVTTALDTLVTKQTDAMRIAPMLRDFLARKP